MNDFNPEEPSKGLGDSIAKLTHALGIDKIADKIAEALGEEDCGCNRRREALNDLISYNNIPKEEYTFTEPRLFEVMHTIRVKTVELEIVYNVGEKILIGPGHYLYSGLSRYLSRKSLIPYATERIEDQPSLQDQSS